MCRKALLVLGLLGSASALPAQELKTLPHRLDSARLAAHAARSALGEYRRQIKGRARWTDSATIASGRIRVYFHESAAPYARAGIAESESQLASLGSFVSRLPQLEFSIGPDSAGAPDGRRRDGMIMVRHHPTPTIANITSTYPDPASIAEVIAGKATEIAVSRSGPDLIRWRSHSLPLASGAPKVDWGVLRLDLVSSASPLGRRCHAGDIPACRMFLGFETVDEPLTTYYDAAGWRALVRENRYLATRANGTFVRRCQAGEDAPCLAVLRLMSDWRQAPATDYARMTLLARALSIGGDRAAERLLTSTGTAADAIAAAARVPLDTVIASWQRDVRDRAAAASNISLPIVVSSILSIAVFLFLSLRSTRWR